MGEFADIAIVDELNRLFPVDHTLEQLESWQREKRKDDKSRQKLRRRFVWTDKEGNKHKLQDIDDRYLGNIIGFLKRRMADIPLFSDEYMGDDLWVTHDNTGELDLYDSLIAFLEWEQEQRRVAG